MDTIASSDTFEVDISGRTNAIRWTNWLPRAERRIRIAKITDDKLMVDALLMCAGAQVDQIFRTKWVPPTDNNASHYEAAKKLLNDHFEPQKNTAMMTLRFRRASQMKGENIDQFLVRLRSMAAACEFGTRIDSEVILAFASGALDTRVRQEAAKNDMTLDNLLKYTQQLEIMGTNDDTFQFKKELGATKIKQESIRLLWQQDLASGWMSCKRQDMLGLPQNRPLCQCMPEQRRPASTQLEATHRQQQPPQQQRWTLETSPSPPVCAPAPD